MSEKSRRDFLQKGVISIAGAGLSLNVKGLFTHMDTAAYLPKIGIQLWSVRDLYAKDLSGTLSQLAEIGFSGVETAFWPDHISLEKGSKALQRAGLPVFSVHAELPLNTTEQQKWLEMKDAYQCKRFVWHGWPEDPRYQHLEGTKELVKVYHETNEFAKEHGIQFGLHNHWWEFESMKDSKMTPFEYLLQEVDQDIFFELDTYWAKVAGKDPAKMMAKFGRRAPLLHIKDGPTKRDKPMTAVGKGKMDVPSIAKAGGEYIEWMIVEIDETEGDMMVAVKDSYDFLVTNGLGKGRK